MNVNNIAARPFISGDLAILEYGDALIDLPERIYDKIYRAVDNLRTQLIAEMLRDDEWSKLVDYAYVGFKDMELVVQVDHDRATELEYGAPGTPMRPFVRPFLNAGIEKLSKIVEEEV